MDSTRPELLSVMFDLIRNGQAHYYHQLPLQLSDEGRLAISLSGPEKEHHLQRLRAGERPTDHLAFEIVAKTLWLYVDPGVLFFDIETAIRRSGLLDGEFNLKRLRTRYYNVSVLRIQEALESAGHPRRTPAQT